MPTWPTNDQTPTVTPRRNSVAKINTRATPLSPEWTDVPLKTPEIIQKTMATLQQSTEPDAAPVPPPRKRRRGIKQILDRMNSEDNLKPVEEAIIVPKKEITHICDPTRHPHHYHKTNGGPRKAYSTVIPPIYNDLDVKKEMSKNLRRGSIPRNASLPGENNLSLSQATAQRLESYMTRCRSFGSLLPQQIMDKIKNTPSSSAANDQSDAESEDSWGGLDDWDLGVIEHDGIDDGLFQPISRLPSKKRSSTDVKFSVGDKNPLPLNANKDKIKSSDTAVSTAAPKQSNGRKSGVNLQAILNPSSINTISESVERKTSENEDVKQAPLARRESIEDIVDWFDKDSDNELSKKSFSEENPKKTDYDKFSSNILYDGVTNPFRIYYEDSSFSSDAFFTSKFLENEKMANNINDNDSPNMSESLDQKAMDFVIVNDDKINPDKLKNSDDDKIPSKQIEEDCPTIVEESIESSSITTKDSQTNNSEDDNIGHSSLLKFFKNDSNTIEDPDRPDRNNAKVDISGFH